jgi:hypothetical protein
MYAARMLKSHLRPWQLSLARKLSVMTYAPVGAGAAEAKPDFGHVALALAGDRLEEFAAPIQTIAESLLQPAGEPLPRFVLRALETCVDASRSQARSPATSHV